jgi:chromosome segregation ATPase
MKPTLVRLLVLVSLALCGVSVAQWRREAALRQRLAEAGAQRQAEAAARLEAIEKSAVLEKEIARLTQLRADTEAKLVEVTDELAAARKRVAGTSDALGERNRAVEEHNAAITEANARLQQVTAERDRALDDLNQRTRAYNDLMTKVNRSGR